jgi:hypothetical protein
LPYKAAPLSYSSNGQLSLIMEVTSLHVTPHRLLRIFGGKDFRFTYPDGNKVEYIRAGYFNIVRDEPYSCERLKYLL